MREIGRLDGESTARRFGDYLYVRGIANEVERTADGRWAVWVEREDHTDEASDLLERLKAGELDEAVARAAGRATERRQQSQQEEERARANYIDLGSRWRSESFLSRGVGPVTGLFIVLSVGMAIWSRLGTVDEVLQPFYITESEIETGQDGAQCVEWDRGLPEVSRGEVWRLVTPMFIHIGLLHLLFNMIWLKDLGSMIERRLGWGLLLGLVGVAAVVSNLAQYGWSGPLFGGMSGVVYGLLGFCWLRGRYDPLSGLTLDPRTVVWMGAWLVICMTGAMGAIANTAHVVGLLVGMAWGFLSSGKLRRMLRGRGEP